MTGGQPGQGNRIAACRVCGDLMPWRELSAHHKSEHPKPKAERSESELAQSAGAGADRVGTTAPASAEIAPDAGSELAPLEPPKRRLRDRIFGGRDSTDDGGPAAPAPGHPKERKPKRATKRVSTAHMLGGAWSLAGVGLVQSQLDAPVGRAMMFQGDAAGEVLEALTRDTFLDPILQRVAAKESELEAAAALIGLPLLVGLYERAGDDLRVVIEPLLVQAVRANFVAMVPAIKKAKAAEEQWRAAVVELGLEGDDPIRDLLVSIFTPAPTEEPAQP